MTSDPALLTIRGLTKSFGPTRALDGVNLTVMPGEVHALLGANGAGKSTLLAIVAGSKSPDTGEVTVTKGDSRGRRHGAAAIVYQELSLLPHLSVLENVAIRELLLAAGSGWRRRRRAQAAARTSLAYLGQASIDLYMRAGDLSLDRQQLVEIARALNQGAQLVLLDEPTASLNQPEVQQLFAVLRGLVATGVGVVLVSHRFREIRAVADVVSVLRDGHTIVDREPLASVSDDVLLQAMIGKAALNVKERAVPTSHITDDSPLFRLALGGDRAPLQVRPGELVGITSLDPSDSRDLLLRAWGDLPQVKGQDMRVLGRSRISWSPRRALRSGVGYVSGDRVRDGVLGQLSVLEHLLGPQRVAKGSFVANPDVSTARRLIDQFSIKLSDLASPPTALSGGNQQKMLFARWAPLAVRLLLLDDPTRGVDLHAKEDIYQAIDEVAAAGGGALWWSSDPEELATRCDRVYVLSASEVTATLAGSGLTEARIVDALHASTTPSDVL